jgi:hypothetical protein
VNKLFLSLRPARLTYVSCTARARLALPSMNAGESHVNESVLFLDSGMAEVPPLRRTPTDEDWEEALRDLSHTELPGEVATVDGGSPTAVGPVKAARVDGGSLSYSGRCAPCSTCWQQLNAAAKSLKRQVLVLYYASLDPAVGVLPKAIVWIALAYALSPLDLIPDFIPLLGTTKLVPSSHVARKQNAPPAPGKADRVRATTLPAARHCRV